MSIDFILGLLLTIPLGILANILTRKYDDVMAKRSISVRGKKLKNLLKEFRYIHSMHKDESRFRLVVLRQIMWGILAGTLLIGTFILAAIIAIESGTSGDGLIDFTMPKWVGNALGVLVLGFSGVGMLIYLRFMDRAYNNLSKVIDFEKYRQNFTDQIDRLGGNPKELLDEDEPPT